MSDCYCVIDNRNKKCVDLSFDDSHCADIAKCCVGLHDAGEHNKCIGAVRKCRKLGNGFDPIAPLKPLPFDYLYTQAPGYATTGNYVEHFNGGAIGDLLNQLFDTKCVIKNAACSLIVALVAKSILGTKVTLIRLITLTLVIALVKCCVAKL